MTALESQKCSCFGVVSEQLSHTFAGIITLLLRILVLSLSFAVLMSIVDAMQKFGSSPLVLPFSTLGQYQPQILKVGPQDPMLAGFDNFLFWYNCAFPGGSRLGSGIGFIGACFWSLHTAPRNCGMQRVVLGLIAGALIGFRLMLMLSSSAISVFTACLISSIAFAVYMARTNRPDSIPPMPIVSTD